MPQPRIRIGYIRVSTASEEQLSALENQRSRIKAAGVDRIYEDVASGLSQTRAGFGEVEKLIDSKTVSELVVTRIDRLGRQADAVDLFLFFAAKRKTLVTALDGGTVDTDSPYGFFQSRLWTSLAELESRMLSLRIHRGLAAARKIRKPLRGRAPWGYQITEDKKALTLDPVEAPRASAFIELLKGLDWRMNTALDVWAATGHGDIPLHSCRAVRAWLLNPILRGGIGYNQRANHQFDEIVWDTHAALLTKEEFNKYEATLAKNKRLWGVNATMKVRLLTGLCVCTRCGLRMPYAGGRVHPALLCKNRMCSQRYKSTPESVVNAAICSTLSHRAEEIATHVAVESPEEIELKASIAKLEAMQDSDLEGVLGEKREKLRKLHKGVSIDTELMEALRDPAFWDAYSYDEKVDLFRTLVDKVEIQDQSVLRVVPRV
jgi:hypothetical protein